MRTRSQRPEPERLIYRWDLDKTYLLSEFGTLRELVKIPFQKPEDKIAAPGVIALIRGLRESAIARGAEVRVYFISASPPQIGRAIRRKLELDGIEYDGIIFKNQLQRLFRGKFRHLREQIGFKLTELLKARHLEPPAVREYLFGDDWESDPLVYSLYADTLGGRLTPAELGDLLRQLRVDPPLIREAQALAVGLPSAEAVERIFINLERPTPPASLRRFGWRLVPTFNYFQTAACLHAQGVLTDAGAVSVARAMIELSGYTPSQLGNSLDDVVRRGHLPAAHAAAVRDALAHGGMLPGRPRNWLHRVLDRCRRPRRPLADAPPVVDYAALLAAQEVAAE
ncbi:MAG: hypothetical protein AB7V27_14590 [Candidatus Binatia bacterium]